MSSEFFEKSLKRHNFLTIDCETSFQSVKNIEVSTSNITDTSVQDNLKLDKVQLKQLNEEKLV